MPRSTPDTRDRVIGLVVVFGFSIGLGVGTITIPLLALASGYDAPAVGFLVATAAATQLGGRLMLPWLLGRFTDRVLIAIASMTMVAAFLLLIASTALPVFVLAQICQGAARAVFWTASQAHAIREQPRPVQRLVDLNVAGNAGTLVGPALGGLLATLGLEAALAAAALGALAAVAGSPFLRRFEPFDRRRSAGTWRLLRRSGVDLACWASVIGGLWWSMMGSYVPVILVGAGIGSIGIGWAVTASEAAGTVALLAFRNVPRARIRPALQLGGLVASVALIGIAFAPQELVVYFALLIVGGAAGGLITTLSPALATLVAGPDEQGDALSLTGAFRAAALFASPAAVGVLVGTLLAGPAMAVVSALTGLSGVAVGRARPVSPLAEAGSTSDR
jgi:MFS family permease